jgi:hypothetical protein
MTAKKQSRSKQAGGGRVTPKGTQPAGTTSNHDHGPTGSVNAARTAKPRVDPVSNRQFSGHAGPSRSAHRGNR